MATLAREQLLKLHMEHTVPSTKGHKIGMLKTLEKIYELVQGTIWVIINCDSSWCNDIGTGNNRSIDDLPVNMLFELDRAGDRLINKAS